MKLLFTLAMTFIFLSTMAQKSDTLSIISPHGSPIKDGLIFTVGDVYKYKVVEENPWEGAVYNYLKIEDIEGGWVKYTKSETLERLDNNPIRVHKLRDFYRLYLKRNEWERL